MTYKEKHSHHLHSAFKVLALSLAMLIPASCAENKEKFSKQQEQGLMDKTPLQTRDKYGAAVTLHLVDVPVYTRSGERKQGQYIVTRGLQSSGYMFDSKKYTRKAYFNNSDDAVYVTTDGNYAVVTEEGKSVGLFVDYNGKVVIVSDQHISDFVRDCTAHLDDARDGHSSSAVERISKVRQQIEENDSTQLSVAADSIHTDTVKMVTDSVSKPQVQPDSEILPADTFTVIRQNMHE